MYIECLAESHEKMLTFIQKYPKSKKLILMEENPLNSKDLTFGIPQIYKDIFKDVVRAYEQNSNASTELDFENRNRESEPIRRITDDIDEGEDPIRIGN